MIQSTSCQWFSFKGNTSCEYSFHATVKSIWKCFGGGNSTSCKADFYCRHFKRHFQTLRIINSTGLRLRESKLNLLCNLNWEKLNCFKGAFPLRLHTFQWKANAPYSSAELLRLGQAAMSFPFWKGVAEGEVQKREFTMRPQYGIHTSLQKPSQQTSLQSKSG